MAKSHPPKVLVTGAAGFIGAHLIRECSNLGFDVIALDDLSGGFEENLSADVAFVHGSVTDDDLVERLFSRHRFDYVYHLAAYAAEGLSHFIRRFNYENNVGGSISLINAAVRHSVKCFVFTSSIAVYGRNQLPMSEELVPQPEDPYGIAKYAVELDLRAAHEMFGLNYVIFRPHNVYGEMQNISDKYRNVIGIFMNQLLQSRPMSIFGDGSQSRAFSYVGDIVGPIARSVQFPNCFGHVFNVGADHPYTVLELANLVAAALEREPIIQHLPSRNEVQHAYANHAKIANFFGQQPKTDLVTGLKRMSDWVVSVGIREPVRFRNIEIDKGLPASWR